MAADRIAAIEVHVLAQRRGLYMSGVAAGSWPLVEEWLSRHSYGWLAVEDGRGWWRLCCAAPVGLSVCRDEWRMGPAVALAYLMPALQEGKPVAVSDEWWAALTEATETRAA